MKKLLLIFIATFISLNVFGQSGGLYSDWYLTSYEIDLGDSVPVSSITPHIYPSLSINNNLEFSGEAACNTFTGSFSYDATNDLLILENIDATLTLCDFQSHENFEIDYFNILFNATFSYSIIYETNGSESLELVSASGEILRYRDYPLVFSVNDNDLTSIIVHPNPTSDYISISSENSMIDSITIYSLTGKKVLEDSQGLNSIDVSALSKGMYFTEVYTDAGRSVKKFIKK
tara:strand:- start:1600 stop:2295 length:696 start_codon:yes stop_codon:yes gene_type:complete